MKPGMLLALLCTFACVNFTYAGESLHLKAGSFDPSQKLLIQNQETTQTDYYIIQFERSPSALNYKELEQQRVEWLAYLPDDALIVRLPKGLEIVDLKATGLRAYWPYQQEFKVDPQLKKINVFNKDYRKNLSVKVFSESELSEVSKNIEKLGAVVIAAKGNYIDVRATLSNIPDIAQMDAVEYIQEKAQIETMMMPLTLDIKTGLKGDYTDLTGYETGTRVMNFEEAWGRGLRGQGQIVAMADTGLDSGDLATLHQDFAVTTHGYAYGLFTESWYDPMGHGTHVAGSVLSSGAASGGQLKGGAYESAFIAQGMWSDLLNNLSIPPTMSDFLEPAYKDGARVHTNSWGSPRNLGAYDGMSQQVDQFMWDNPEMLILFAAGNSGLDENKDGRVDEGSVSSPSTAKNCLSVGASENQLSQGGIQRKVGDLAGGRWSAEPLGSDYLSDNADGIAVFSSRGPTKDGRLKPDVVAPGTNILSNCSQVKDASPLWGNYNKEYCYSGGTSMAAPLAAGAAAVVRQNLIQNGIANPSAAVVKAVLMNTATDLYPGQFGNVGKSKGQEILAPGPNFHQGHGRVDMAKATKNDFEVNDNTTGLEQGESFQYRFGIKDGVQSAKITLVYTDRPAASAASKALVNNLDIVASFPDGTTHSGTDAINNSEYLLIPTKGQSTIDITVKGTRVMSGGQPYALVVSYQ